MSWINVDDQLPRTNIAVLVKKQDVYAVAIMDSEKKFYLDDTGLYACGDSHLSSIILNFVPTHWMYIPL